MIEIRIDEILEFRITVVRLTYTYRKSTEFFIVNFDSLY